jgi:uncharacterized membrane protein YcaP (DUF421 family)
MRLAGIAYLREVAWGIVEPHGRISFIKKKKSDDSDDSRQLDADNRIR